MNVGEYINLDAKMFNFETWVEDARADYLKSLFEDLLTKSGFNIVNFTEHYFPVQGYTCVWLLAESHMALHTFPKDNKTYVQLSSCNKEKLESFVELYNQLI